MKLIIQIPAFNEEKHLKLAIDDIRKNINLRGFESYEIIVINDGSNDSTLEVARNADIKYIVNFEKHLGLMVAFKEGLRRALELGADIIVNTDADAQYRAGEINNLIRPILDNKADMVIGDRQLAKLPDYPSYKFISQTAGNFLISRLFRADIKDATSGFRALTKDAASILIKNMTNTYTYTIESLCLLLNEKNRIAFVAVNIRDPMRKSRLITNKICYVCNYLFTAFKYYFKRYK